MISRSFYAFATVLLVPALVLAGDTTSSKSPSTATTPHTHGPNWLTGDGVSLGGILFPHIHGLASYGNSSTDPESLASGHHDPDREGWTMQNLEFGVSGRFNEYFEAFTTYAAKIDLDDRWDGEFEEWFGKIKGLPGGFELRGGQYYNRFGFQNSLHPHGFDYVDQYLVNGRFLGDDALTSIGGEVSWKLPVSWTSQLDVSVGVTPEREEHSHGEEKEEHLYEAEGALFNDTLVTANWTNQFNYNDFHQFRAGASGAWGDNVWGRMSQVYGVHFQYEWRENGFEAGGSYLRWRTEAMLRSFGAVSGHLPGEEPAEEEGEEHEAEVRRATLDEVGIYSTVSYGLDNGLEFGLRGDYVSGIAEAGLDERYRVSPTVTYYLNHNRTLYFRAQYNYDHSNDFGEEHSVWGQIGINWGSPHVR